MWGHKLCHCGEQIASYLIVSLLLTECHFWEIFENRLCFCTDDGIFSYKDNQPVCFVLDMQFLGHARQLDAVRPLAAYHCRLYYVQSVLQTGKHLEDPELAAQLGDLLNSIEEQKPQLDQQVLGSPEKCFQYMFGFASSVFDSAFQQVQDHRASKSTVRDFKSALDFIRVLDLWPEMVQQNSQEISKMNRYAKFHMARILKALKEGNDPNDYISPEEESQLEQIPKEDAGEDDSDAHGLPAAPTELNEPADETETFTDSQLDLPAAPKEIEGDLNMPIAPVLIKGQKNSLGLPSAPPDTPLDLGVQAQEQEEDDEEEEEEKIEAAPPVLPPKVSKPTPKVAAEPSKVMSRSEVEKIWKRDEIVQAAQKSAKYAIGALNYDDIATAVRELESALNALKSIDN